MEQTSRINLHLPYADLVRGRTHEVLGNGAVFFAVLQAARVSGPVLWITAPEGGLGYTGRLDPLGLNRFFDPARLVWVEAASRRDGMACMEDALRASACRLVVADIGTAAELKESRRLQLAARAGQTTGLSLISGPAQSNAAETRWHCETLADMPVLNRECSEVSPGDSICHRWSLIKNKTGTFGVWDIRCNGETNDIRVVAQSVGGASSALRSRYRSAASAGRHAFATERLAALLAQHGRPSDGIGRGQQSDRCACAGAGTDFPAG